MTVKKQFGFGLIILSIASMILWFAEISFRFLYWIDLNGPVVGWGIRIAILLVGIYVYRTGDEIE